MSYGYQNTVVLLTIQLDVELSPILSTEREGIPERKRERERERERERADANSNLPRLTEQLLGPVLERVGIQRVHESMRVRGRLVFPSNSCLSCCSLIVTQVT